MMAGPEKATLRTKREALIPKAKGHVLEIGAGTGANLPFYEGVERLTLTEPDKLMVHRLEPRLRERSPGRGDVDVAGTISIPARTAA